MKKLFFLALAPALALSSAAESLTVSSPDRQLAVMLDITGGRATYSVNYGGKTMLDPSPLGFRANIGNFETDATGCAPDF